MDRGRGWQDFAGRFGLNQQIAGFLNNHRGIFDNQLADEFSWSAPTEYFATPMFVVMDRVVGGNLSEKKDSYNDLYRFVAHKLLPLGKLLQLHNVPPFGNRMLSELKSENIILESNGPKLYVIDQGTPII